MVDCLAKANRLHDEAMAIEDNSYDTYVQITRLLQESQNYYEWHNHGCLIGRPGSTWTP